MIRDQLAKAPSFLWPDYNLKTYEGQNEFIVDLGNKPEMQEELQALQSEAPAITYPYASNDPNALFLGPVFGRIKMKDANVSWQNGYRAGVLQRAEAMRMMYFLNASDELNSMKNNWTTQLIDYLDERINNNDSFKYFYLTVHSEQLRLESINHELLRLVPFLLACVVCLMVFTGLTTVRGFPVHRTLPWIGPIGVLTSVMGVGSAFGLLGWIGYPIADLCFAIPVLILAVGIDDVFVYSENYRETNPARSTRSRIAKMMRHASPGIVVTSFMNSLAFIIGLF